MRIQWIGLALAIVLAMGGCAVTEHISNVGFRPVSSPAPIYQPGQVVGIVRVGNVTVDARPVCPYGTYIGSPVPTVSELSTAGQTHFTGTFDALGAYGDWLAPADRAAVRRITLRLSNITVESVDAAMVFDGLAEQTTDCTQALKAATGDATRALVYVARALKADATYTVEFEAGLSPDATRSVLERLNAALTGGAGTRSGNTIVATGIYFGIGTDPNLVRTPR
jgi:hypothetical protein